eukprot:CAMPEP_0119091124 /NCGR_PEP_ID=MMETSP1178-20130426/155236_1 /TAXON_ID=33656 /ORGANISM="unid sp, Strain CCMP2000" /LENGTH=235 /DNA_ID=CAMNT_0007074601 /DNA_START=10 /DNA_END=717 /DNA_ORIENTATION=+
MNMNKHSLVLLATVAAAHRAPFRVHSIFRVHRMPRASVRFCEESKPELDAADVSGLYASLRKRQKLLSSRRDAAVRERELLAELAGASHEEALSSIWQHWFCEEGEAQGGYLKAAGGNAAALQDMMEQYPDWAEPANRLATLRYMEGDFEESIDLCLRVLRMKPWHFGAGSGIVMCYARLAEQAPVLRRGALVAEANRWAAEAMPQPGRERDVWVARMLQLMDTKLAELAEISDD